MKIQFESTVIFWHGPSPFLFVPLPEDISKTLKEINKQLSYGWGCIPVKAKINVTEWTTSLMPKNGIYLLPIKMAVQKAENINVDSIVNATIWLDK